jgi:clan AA aspartic protease (TIGR02281 family)
MLRWAVGYLVVAIVAGASFAMLEERDWARPGLAARDVAGDGPRQRAERPRPDRGDDDADVEQIIDAGDVEQIIDAGPHGHFLVEAVVNGVPIDFMVDTGASHVVLTLQDARKLGFSASNLDFTDEFESANGAVQAAPVELREFRVGQFQLYDVEAFVNGGPLPISLLGMSFLQRLSSYEVARGRLILRW